MPQVHFETYSLPGEGARASSKRYYVNCYTAVSVFLEWNALISIPDQTCPI